MVEGWFGEQWTKGTEAKKDLTKEKITEHPLTMTVCIKYSYSGFLDKGDWLLERYASPLHLSKLFI